MTRPRRSKSIIFHKIEQIMEAFKPKRVVLDSLSTYGSSLGTDGRLFRDFFHALVALMKEHQVAAVYNNENPELLGMSSLWHMRIARWSTTSSETGSSSGRRLPQPDGARCANPCVARPRMEVITAGQRVLDRGQCRRAFSRFSSLLSRAPDRRERANSVD